jgi:hypothetical protein
MVNKSKAGSAGLVVAIITLFFASSNGALAGAAFAARIGTGGKCEGDGVCRVIPGFAGDTARTVQASGEINGNTMTINFRGKLPEGSDNYPIDHDIVLDQSISKALGFKTVTILKGEYRLNRGANTLNVRVRTTKNN